MILFSLTTMKISYEMYQSEGRKRSIDCSLILKLVFHSFFEKKKWWWFQPFIQEIESKRMTKVLASTVSETNQINTQTLNTHVAQFSSLF